MVATTWIAQTVGSALVGIILQGRSILYNTFTDENQWSNSEKVCLKLDTKWIYSYRLYSIERWPAVVHKKVHVLIKYRLCTAIRNKNPQQVQLSHSDMPSCWQVRPGTASISASVGIINRWMRLQPENCTIKGGIGLQLNNFGCHVIIAAAKQIDFGCSGICSGLGQLVLQ